MFGMNNLLKNALEAQKQEVQQRTDMQAAGPVKYPLGCTICTTQGGFSRFVYAGMPSRDSFCIWNKRKGQSMPLYYPVTGFPSLTIDGQNYNLLEVNPMYVVLDLARPFA